MKEEAQGLKPSSLLVRAARLKPCPSRFFPNMALLEHSSGVAGEGASPVSTEFFFSILLSGGLPKRIYEIGGIGSRHLRLKSTTTIPRLFHAGNRRFDCVNVGAHVASIGGCARSGRDLRTARPFGAAEPWILADGALEVVDASRFGRADDEASLRKRSAPADDEVLVELIWIKARLQHGFTAPPLAPPRAALRAPARRGYRPLISDGKHAVGHYEVRELGSGVCDLEQCTGDKSGYVINLDVVQRRFIGGEDEEVAETGVILVVQVVGEEVVNAVAATVGGGAAGLRDSVANEQDGGNIPNPVETDGDVVDAAKGALVRLIFRGEDD